jgi:hypothetical protein
MVLFHQHPIYHPKYYFQYLILNISELKHLNLIFLQISILFVIKPFSGLLFTTALATANIYGRYFNDIFFYFSKTWINTVNFLSASASNAFKIFNSSLLY